MKKFAILLLSILTISATIICGCAENKENNNSDDKVQNPENIQIQESDDTDEDNKRECPDKPEFPDKEKRDNKIPYPHPHRPHLFPDEKLPRPKPIKP